MTLEAQQLAISRGGRVLLEDVDLILRPGEVTVIVGPNGAGKSTLLSALSGDEAPSSGHVTLNGVPVQQMPLDTLAEQRAVVAAPPVLAFDYTVRDVVAMGWLHGGPGLTRQFESALQQVLQSNELCRLANRRYMTLSSGERQRVTFARACLQLWRIDDDANPRWLLLDEPNANLDVAHGVAMLEALRALAAQGDGVLAILHDLDLAARFADRIAVVANGRLVAVGEPAEVLTPALLSEVYQTPIHVEHHQQLNRLVVIG